jgi:hypothetical protein
VALETPIDWIWIGKTLLETFATRKLDQIFEKLFV